MKRIVEFESEKALEFETPISLETLDKKFQAIDENFYNIEFSCQQFKGNVLTGEYIYKLPKSILDKVVVNLDMASDEFYLDLSNKVVVREEDENKVFSHDLLIEVVTEEIAKGNDSDFMGISRHKALIKADDYEVGKTNSYYKTLGTVDGTTFYYREL